LAESRRVHAHGDDDLAGKQTPDAVNVPDPFVQQNGGVRRAIPGILQSGNWQRTDRPHVQVLSLDAMQVYQADNKIKQVFDNLSAAIFSPNGRLLLTNNTDTGLSYSSCRIVNQRQTVTPLRFHGKYPRRLGIGVQP
jgi:hypothetical protein